MSFLAEAKLSRKIRLVLTGDDIKCAVAFWGSSFVDTLLAIKGRHKTLKAAKVICNIDMGATNPKALRALGAPKAANIRHYKALHAKVYISSLGAVVTSANATMNGVGSKESDAHLCEAGNFYAPGSDDYQAVTEWFDGLYERSEQVTDADLDQAQLLFNMRGRPPVPPTPPGSMFRYLVDDQARPKSEQMFPEYIGFVFSRSEPSKKELAASREKAMGVCDKTGTIESVEDEWIYVDWPDNMVAAWPSIFISVHLKIIGSKCTIDDIGVGSLVFSDTINRNVFCKDAEISIKSIFKNKADSKTILRKDSKLAGELYANMNVEGGLIFASAEDLIDAIHKEGLLSEVSVQT